MCPDASSPAVNAVTTSVMGYSPVELQQAQADDQVIGKLLQAKQANCRPSVAHSTGETLEYRRLLQQWDQLLIQDGLLWRIFAQPQERSSWKQLVVPQKFRTDILKHLHEGVTGGHLGQDKTLHNLKERFYWPGHYNDIRDWCQTCGTCAKRKSPPTSGRAPMPADNNHSSDGCGLVRATPREQQWELICSSSGGLLFQMDGGSASAESGSPNCGREVG